MKKLRIIVTSAIVLAIVGSAFAFKAKVGTYCVLTNTDSGNTCTTYIQGKKTASSGFTTYKYAPWFDGDRDACTTTTNHLCTQSAITFVAD